MAVFTLSPKRIDARRNERLIINRQTPTSGSGGNINDAAFVPENKVWRLVAYRISNPDTIARDLQVSIADDVGTTLLTPIPSSVTEAPVSVSNGAALSWEGELLVPGGYRIQAAWNQMAGGLNLEWAYMVYESDF